MDAQPPCDRTFRLSPRVVSSLVSVADTSAAGEQFAPTNFTPSTTGDAPLSCQQNDSFKFKYDCQIDALSDLSRVPHDARSLRIRLNRRLLPRPPAAAASTDNRQDDRTTDRSNFDEGEDEDESWALPDEIGGLNVTELIIPTSVLPRTRRLDHTGVYRSVPKVPRRAFAALPQLTKLTIDNDEAGDSGLLLVNGSFDGLPKLNDLGLARLGIDCLEAGSLRGLDALINLDLYGNRLTKFSALVTGGGGSSLPCLRNLGLGNNRIVDVKQVRLPHGGGTCFTASSTHSGFQHRPPQLVVDLHDNRIRSLGRRAFFASDDEAAAGLRPHPPALDASRSLPKTKTAAAASIKQPKDLTTVGSVGGWSRVVDLNLARNRIVSLTAGAFDGLTSMRTIHLDNNNITSFHSDSIAGAPKLQLLNMADNRLSSIDAGTDRRRVAREKSESTPEESVGCATRHKVVSVAVRLDGNPWNCDCRLWCRMKHLFDFDGFRLDDSRTQAVCRSPVELDNMPLSGFLKLSADNKGVMWNNVSAPSCRHADCDDSTVNPPVPSSPPPAPSDPPPAWVPITVPWVAVLFLALLACIGALCCTFVATILRHRRTSNVYDVAAPRRRRRKSGYDIPDGATGDKVDGEQLEDEEQQTRTAFETFDDTLCSITCCSFSVECKIQGSKSTVL